MEGAEPGDGIAIRIRDITVTSIATASGHDSSPSGYCLGDPYVAARCPTCDEVWPETHLEGILCAEIGVTQDTRPDHAQYIAHWLQLIRNDPKAIFTAAAKASAAVAYLKGLQPAP